MNQEFKNRRQKLYAEIGKDVIVILASAKEYVVNGGLTSPYRQTGDFYYLTGITEPDTIAVFIPNRPEGEFLLFNRQADQTQETWTGKMTGQEGACTIYGADQAFPIQEVDNLLPDLILGKRHLYFAIGQDTEFDIKIIQWLTNARKKTRTGLNAPDDFSHIGKITHEMRLLNSPYEINLMRKSAKIAEIGHLRAMQACKPNMFEYELEAELNYEYLRHGGKLAFEPIVAGGVNACTLHYMQKNSQLKDGDLVLVDSGVDYQYYNSDITRTFPIGKKFNAAQHVIYQAVLDTQLEVIKKIRPGTRWCELQETSEHVITEALLKLGILEGTLTDLITSQKFKTFYPHRIGHWLGLECHDVGKYAFNKEWRILEPGMTFTVEPGIYIPAHTPNVDRKWWNIGVRIEDDILVTANGCEVLTDELPKTIKDIEETRSSA